MQYAEYAPVPELSGVVQRLWTLEGSHAELGGADQPVLPDGCPELVLHFGDPFDRVMADGSVQRQPLTIFAGQLLAELRLRPTGRVRVMGVRFHPFGATALGIGPLGSLSSLTIDPADASARLGRALDRVRNENVTDDLARAVSLVQDALLTVIDPAAVDPRLRRAVAEIARRGGQISIDRLAAGVAWTRRHLERQFISSVGVGPKRLARITRFQRALQMLDSLGHDETSRRGTVTAAACGYADQAHFIREFRALAGCAPTAHLAREAELTRLFAGI